MFSRYEDGRLFRRSIIGYRTEERARVAEKILWHQDHAVRVEKGWWRWHVWRSG